MYGQTSTPRRSIFALATFIASALAAASFGAAPAAAQIYDGDAAPSHVLTISGDGSGADYSDDVVIARGFTYVVGTGTYTGAGSDATLTRISHTTWTAATTHYDGAAHGNDGAAAVALGPDGAIYTAGSTAKGGGLPDMLVIRWSRSGTVVWARRYAGPAGGNDWANDIAVDGAGNVVVCGVSTGANELDWAVVSWTTKGVRRWVWRWDGSGKSGDTAADLLLDAKGRAYVCGSVTVAGAKQAAAVAKLSATGAPLWRRTYTGPLATGAWVNAIAADPRGGVLVAGFAEAGVTGQDAMVVRYSSSGAPTVFPLERVHADAGPDIFVDLAVTTTRRVIAVGYRGAPASQRDPMEFVYTLDGTNVGGGAYESTVDDRWRAVAADSFGGFVATGAYGNDGTTIYTRRESTVSGGMGWELRWAGPVQPQYNTGWAVATRGNMVVVAGNVYSGAETGSDQVALVWLY